MKFTLKPSTRRIAGAGVLALAVTLVLGFEGRVLHVYPDPVTHGPPWTYCDGETTTKPDFKHVYTNAECDAVTLKQLHKVDDAVMACVGQSNLPTKVRAAFDSLAWNIGTGGFCKSSVASLAHDGKLTAACNRIPLYNRAAGRVIPGLVTRRGAEKQTCLEGVAGV